MHTLSVISPHTKHYYAGTENIAAQVGQGNFYNINSSIASNQLTSAKLATIDSIALYLSQYATPRFTYLYSLPVLSTTEKEIYYYHTDHLGSSAWITDSLGHAVQHLGYLPWGEPYVTQKTGNFNPTYTFSGKERDEETGYSYFGQRFYDSQLSIWISVDPMRGKYPSLSPFVYCANNPIKLVDPTGEEIVIVGDETYQTMIIIFLRALYNSGKAGAFLVKQAIKSDKKFVIANTKREINDGLSENNNATILPFNIANQFGTLDESNGSVKRNPLTVLAHELAHFNFPKRGTLYEDKNIRAGEVNAVEWENRVRKDLGMAERKLYCGLYLYGKTTIRSTEKDVWILQNNPNYGNNDFSVPNYGKPSTFIETRQPFYIRGSYFDSYLENPAYRKQLKIKYKP